MEVAGGRGLQPPASVSAGGGGGGGGGGATQLFAVQTLGAVHCASVVHCTHTPALQMPRPATRLQSALAVQATHLAVASHLAVAGVSAQSALLPTTHSQPPLGLPSHVASSPATVHESAAAGPTEPEHVLNALLELLAPATHSWRP